MPNRVGGVLFLTIASKSYIAKGNFTITLPGDDRQAVKGANAIAGYRAEPRVPGLEGELLDDGNLDTAELDAATDVTATLGLGNGKTFVLSHAFANAPSYETEDGTVKISLQGTAGQLV